MNGKDAIKTARTSTQDLLARYLSDLSDADLLVRPVPGANYIALQVGHVIASDVHLIREQLPSAAYPELPGAFGEKHRIGNAGESTEGFAGKSHYLALFNK